MIRQHLLFCFFTLVVSGCCVAQYPKAGDYLSNNNIDKFVGTWKWESDSGIIVIKLKKVKYLYPKFGYYQDLLFGSHSYLRNGSIIESSIEDFDMVSSTKKGTISLLNDVDDGPNKAEGSLVDLNKNQKVVRLRLEYVDGSTPRLIWETSAFDQYVMPPTPIGFTLPRNLILLRQ